MVPDEFVALLAVNAVFPGRAIAPAVGMQSRGVGVGLDKEIVKVRRQEHMGALVARRLDNQFSPGGDAFK